MTELALSDHARDADHNQQHSSANAKAEPPPCRAPRGGGGHVEDVGEDSGERAEAWPRDTQRT
eukprot:61269-Rhodomonas_salina.3